MVLDASVLIAFLDPSDALHDDAVSSLLTVDPGRLLVSPVTHAEILVAPVRAGTVAATQAALNDLGDQRGRPAGRRGAAARRPSRVTPD